MKIELIKNIGGSLTPASEMDEDKLKKIKNGTQMTVDIKVPRNYLFHKKVFAFFTFCFEHWCANKTHWENLDTPDQFDAFRKELTKLAGFTVTTYTLDGKGFNVEAKSLSFNSMSQDEFEACYSALINAAIKTVFNGVNDHEINNRLLSFF